MKVICVHNKWKTDVVVDWQDCYWENQEMISMLDTTKLTSRLKYYAQIKLEITNGETILSPQMKIEII